MHLCRRLAPSPSFLNTHQSALDNYHSHHPEMPLQIPQPNTPLYLYRHLLREASYLPPLCRPWIASRIKARYRDCQYTKVAKPYIKEAHHWLRYLRSANAGHVSRLLRLCYLATGRVGKRRRQLSTFFLTKLPHANTADLDNTDPINGTGANPDDREPDWLDNWVVSKIQPLAKSQVQHQNSTQSGDWPQAMRRSLDPNSTIPTENSFGRPFPKRVMRNKLKRHWASILRQILPPLPQGEWDRLKDLASGRATGPEDFKLPPRRPLARSISGEGSENEGDEGGWDLTEYATKPVRAIERKSSRRMKSLTGALDQDPRGQGRPIGVRTLGNRTLRRGVYGRVFECSPKMTEAPNSKNWKVEWGSSEIRLSKPAAGELDFFKGVDQRGKPLGKHTSAGKLV